MRELLAAFRERYSTALMADAGFRAGVAISVPPPGLLPLTRLGMSRQAEAGPPDKIAGPVITVEANNDLVSIIAAVHRAASGEVVVVANGVGQAGLMGDLIATEAKRKGLAGIIVDGCVRDAVEVLDIGVPVFCRGVSPVGPLKLPAELKGIGEVGVAVKLGEAEVRPGDWIFGDADGVIFVAAGDLPALADQARRSFEYEERLSAEIRSGNALGELLGIEAFLEWRDRDPSADFNAHLARLGRAI